MDAVFIDGARSDYFAARYGNESFGLGDAGQREADDIGLVDAQFFLKVLEGAILSSTQSDCERMFSHRAYYRKPRPISLIGVRGVARIYSTDSLRSKFSLPGGL